MCCTNKIEANVSLQVKCHWHIFIKSEQDGDKVFSQGPSGETSLFIQGFKPATILLRVQFPNLLSQTLPPEYWMNVEKPVCYYLTMLDLNYFITLPVAVTFSHTPVSYGNQSSNWVGSAFCLLWTRVYIILLAVLAQMQTVNVFQALNRERNYGCSWYIDLGHCTRDWFSAQGDWFFEENAQCNQSIGRPGE